MIVKQKVKRVGYAVIYAGIALILAWLFLFVAKDLVKAEATIINVTTTVDEDSDPGDGCSLYEAVISANTATAYGGCTAGDAEGPNTIVLPAGTYARDTEEGPLEDANLELGSINLVGAGADQTILDGYWLELNGDTASSVEDLTIYSSDVSLSVNLYINGSNKTISGVEIEHATMGTVNIYLSSGGEEVTNILFLDGAVIATPSSNPATSLVCVTDEVCSDITIDNFNISSQFSTSVFSSGNVDSLSVMNSILTAITSGSTTLAGGDNSLISGSNIDSPNNTAVTLGDNSSVVGSTIDVTAGGNVLTLGDGSNVNGLSQDNASGGTDVAGFADSLSNITQTSSGGASLRIIAEHNQLVGYSATTGGSVTLDGGTDLVSDVTVNSDVFVFSGSTAEVSGFDIAASSTLTFDNDLSSAVFNNISLEYTGADSSYPAVNISGDGVEINDFSVIRTQDGEGSNQGNLNFEGTSATITDLRLVNSYVTGDSLDEFDLSSFTAEGPSHLPAFSISGDVSNVNINNGYIAGSRDGISITADSLTGGNVTIQNVQFEDVIGDEETYTSSIGISSVENIAIRDVTIDSSLVGISLIDGKNYNISNSSVVNSGVGILVASYSATDAASLNINNSTLFALESEVPINPTEALGGVAAIMVAGVSADINTNVSNSLIGGDGVYDDCAASIPINFTNSFVTDSSCAGATEYEDFSGVLEYNLADNGSENDSLGYQGSFGNLHTLSLLASSPAIGFGNSDTCEDVDARGFSRPSNPGCDIGAFQYNTVAYVPPEDEEDNDPLAEEGGSNSSNGGANAAGGNINDDPDPEGDDQPVSSDDDSTDGSSNLVDKPNDTAELASGSSSGSIFWTIAGSIAGFALLAWLIIRLAHRSNN